MKRIIILLVLVMCCMGGVVSAQVMTAMRDSAKGGYNFWLYEPAKASWMDKRPLIIFLHGASLKGNDLSRVLRYGPLHAASRGIEIDAYVVAPQTASNWDADKIWKCVEWVTAHYPINKNRISVIGMSLGGFGTFELATKYYDKLAAGMMLCGGNTNTNYCGLTKMPFWIMHGTADKPVPISRSNSIVAAMKACGDTTRLLYTKLKGANHSYPAKVFYLTETYDWLTSHALSDEDRAVKHTPKIPQEMISGAYGRLSGVQNAVKIINHPPKQSSTSSKQGSSAGSNQGSSVNSNQGSSAGSNQGSGTTEKEKSDVKNGENPEYHVVVSGNTLYSIAKRYNTTVEKLCQLNNIKENSILQIGQKIKLPK